MRALSFLFALMVGLALACIAPAMAGGRGQAPEAMMAPEAAVISSESSDLLASDLFAELNVAMAPGLDASA
jgi:hypothetical protein